MGQNNQGQNTPLFSGTGWEAYSEGTDAEPFIRVYDELGEGIFRLPGLNWSHEQVGCVVSIYKNGLSDGIHLGKAAAQKHLASQT